jgi:hypothetical protein
MQIKQMLFPMMSMVLSMASKDCLPNRLQKKKLVGFFTNEFFYSYNHPITITVTLLMAFGVISFTIISISSLPSPSKS